MRSWVSATSLPGLQMAGVFVARFVEGDGWWSGPQFLTQD